MDHRLGQLPAGMRALGGMGLHVMEGRFSDGGSPMVDSKSSRLFQHGRCAMMESAVDAL